MGLIILLQYFEDKRDYYSVSLIQKEMLQSMNN